MKECYRNIDSLKLANCLQGVVGDEDDTYLDIEFFTLSLRHAIYQAIINTGKKKLDEVIYEHSI